MLIVFTNIDIISGPCNNIIKDSEGRLETLCNQCFMGDKALLRTDFLQQLGLVEKIRQNYPDASYFFYPMEISVSQQVIPLMLETGQKAMTNGKTPGISGILADKGFQQVSFSLYSDWKEMNVFYNYTEKDFDNVIQNIIEAVKRSLEVEVFSIVTPLNFKKLPNLYELSERLGVSKISLLPLEPLGKAKEMDDGYFLDQDSFEQIIQVVKTMKKKDKPYVSMGFGFGPSRSSIERFFSYETESWVKTKTMCPAINNGYAAIYDNDVYFCFKTLDEPFGKIGYVEDTGKIILEKKYDLSSQTIIDRIDGICSKCNNLSDCLGGCRSKAIADNLREYPRLSFEDVLYKGQKFCRFYSETEGDDYAKTI